MKNSTQKTLTTKTNTGAGKHQKNKSFEVGHNMVNQLCGENLDFTLEKQIEIAKIFEHKVSQSSLLMHVDFIVLKALETHADILQIRFGITLNLNTTPFFWKSY